MPAGPIAAALEEISRKWIWFLILGVVLIFLGATAIGNAWMATLVSVATLGWLLILSGVSESVAAIWARQWSGLFQHLLFGLLAAIAGILLLNNPAMSAATLTLVLAAFFLIRGILRIIGAVMLRYPNWGWAAFDGALTTILGAMIWAQWPTSAIWLIGLFIGLDLISRGVSWLMFAMGAKRLSSLGQRGNEAAR
jgi:uncharacterized membrane protein HdeD (DUF308 family)